MSHVDTKGSYALSANTAAVAYYGQRLRIYFTTSPLSTPHHKPRSAIANKHPEATGLSISSVAWSPSMVWIEKVLGAIQWDGLCA
jgi:hypothetical protein